jgi:hypothetical protein
LRRFYLSAPSYLAFRNGGFGGNMRRVWSVLAIASIAVSGVGSLTSEARAISLEDAVRLTVTSNPEIGAASGNRDAILQE